MAYGHYLPKVVFKLQDFPSTKFKSYVPGEPLFTTAEILKEYRT